MLCNLLCNSGSVPGSGKCPVNPRQKLTPGVALMVYVGAFWGQGFFLVSQGGAVLGEFWLAFPHLEGAIWRVTWHCFSLFGGQFGANWGLIWLVFPLIRGGGQFGVIWLVFPLFRAIWGQFCCFGVANLGPDFGNVGPRLAQIGPEFVVDPKKQQTFNKTSFGSKNYKTILL